MHCWRKLWIANSLSWILLVLKQSSKKLLPFSYKTLCCIRVWLLMKTFYFLFCGFSRFFFLIFVGGFPLTKGRKVIFFCMKNPERSFLSLWICNKTRKRSWNFLMLKNNFFFSSTINKKMFFKYKSQEKYFSDFFCKNPVCGCYIHRNDCIVGSCLLIYFRLVWQNVAVEIFFFCMLLISILERQSVRKM